MKAKEIEKTSKKKGISLIMLVITIIVIIILAVAVILSIANNNPIENAKKAKEANNNAVEKEKIELLKQAKLMKQSLGTKTEDEVNEEIIKANYPDLNYEEDFKNSRGKKVYVGEDEKIKEELQEGLGVLTVKKDILEYVNQITDTNLIVNDCYLTGLAYTTKNETGEFLVTYTVEELLAKLPEGSKMLVQQTGGSFRDANNTEEVSTGLKIQDKNGNDMLYTVFFGSVTGSGYGDIIDCNFIKRFIEDQSTDSIIKRFDLPEHGFSECIWYAADANGDGIISKADCDALTYSIREGDDFIKNQFRPVTIGLKVE